jgi:hypothetical protein
MAPFNAGNPKIKKNNVMKLPQFKFMTALVVGMISIGSVSQAALITTSPTLPPAGVYSNPGSFQSYGGPALAFILTLPAYTPDTSVVIRTPGGGGNPGTAADEYEEFGSTLTGMVDVLQNGISITGGPQSISASGPVGSSSWLVGGKIGNVTGTFNTEMLALNLSGVSPLGPFMIRESPTRASLGQTSITDIGGGLYQIDSFFDVFTELSIDGGATWMPSTTGSGHLALPVPEPAGVTLLVVGLASMMRSHRRR